jgi:hypothetical protein
MAVLSLAIWAAAVNTYRQMKAREHVEEYIKNSRGNYELLVRLCERLEQQVRAIEKIREGQDEMIQLLRHLTASPHELPEGIQELRSSNK